MRKNSLSKIAVLISAAAVLALTGCAGKGNTPESGNGGENVQAAGVSREKGVMRDITSAELTEEIGIGWNLGNTLDVCAADRDGDGIVNEVPENGRVDETLWGNIPASKELFERLEAEGVNAVRIPVTWRDHMGEAPDYTVDGEWMDRVQEVVNYAYDLDMYVIINIHHDGGDDAKFGAWVRGAAEDYGKFDEKYTALWTQICERFKDYSDKLIFESANEIGFDSLPKDEAYELLNKINSRFVEIVRSSGGNNEKRHLLIAGYWTDIAETCDKRFKMPDDLENRLILSVHYYTPWEFCITNKRLTWGSEEDMKLLENKMEQLYDNFAGKGVPVIIGEYGFYIGNQPASCVKFASAVTKTCSDRGIKCFLWDNGEVFDRSAYIWRVDGLGEALRESAGIASSEE